MARLLVFAALLAAATAIPVTLQENDKCAETCTPSTAFVYETGTTYSYDYRVDTATSMAGASEDSARLTIQANALIEVLTPCEFILSFKNTRLFHSDAAGTMVPAQGEVGFQRELESSSLRFSFQNGAVDHTCKGNEKEEPWALNIKKGFLSAFQNSMGDLTMDKNMTETDINGQCQTSYKVNSNGYYTTSVKKSKNLLSCTERDRFNSIVQTTPYLVQSDIQSLPILKSSLECDQTMDNSGILKSTECREVHVYRPFSNGQSGGQTSITQKVTYNTYYNRLVSTPGSISSRESLVFDHSAVQPMKEQARNAVEQKLREICDNTQVDIRPESPRLFTELLVSLKSLEKEDMDDLYRLLKSKTICPTNDRTYNFFLDAVALAGTRASVSLMTSLITNKDVKGLTAQAWLASLAFIQEPTAEMILDTITLIEDKNIGEDAMLPVSSMINNYCKKSKTCSEDYAVLTTIAALEDNINSRCDASGKKFEKTLLTLRAIGNAGHATHAVSVLNKCLTSDANSLEIRIAAAEGFRRMPCDANDKDLWATYLNLDLDSELRIASYLALMRCPTDLTLGKLAASLAKEENEQVGAFVYSHLTNLRETSDPHKMDVARSIQNLALEKEFDLSPLKSSRNFEISALINKLNTGVTAESNVIWSSETQMPRSVSGNLTVELFGNAVNIMDFGGRLEGLEHLITSIFGPYLNGKEKETTKRSNLDKVQGSIYGRVFGNEMLFLHSKINKSPISYLPNNILDILIKLSKKQEHTFTQGFQFLQFSSVHPTTAGLPIHVNINGTATVDLHVSGKMDLRKVGASPRSMDVDGEVRPSAAMEVTGTMTVNAFVTKMGMRMRNTMHSSTSMKGRIQLLRGQQLNIELDTPEDKQEIFEARSKFFIIHNTEETEQKMITENRKTFDLCSGNKMATITGMELCGHVSFANASMESNSPYFPLTGPTEVTLVLNKMDTHSGYKLLAKRLENKKASVAQISFNTPGSTVNRFLSLDMKLNYGKQDLDINVVSPWKKAAVRGNLINQKDMQSISASLVIDEKDTYSVTGEVKTSSSKSKLQLSPMIQIRSPKMDDLQMTGLIAVERPLKALDLDITVSGINKMPYNFKTSLVNNKKEKMITARFSPDGKREYSLESSNTLILIGKKSYSASAKNTLKISTPTRELVDMLSAIDFKEGKTLKIDSSLRVPDLMKKPATIKVTLGQVLKKKLSRYDAEVYFKTSPLNFRFDSNIIQKATGSVNTRTILDYNIARLPRNKVIHSGKFQDYSSKILKKYSYRSNMEVKRNPEFNHAVTVNINHKKTHSDASLDLKYGNNFKNKTKRVYLKSSLDKNIASWKNGHLKYRVNADAPEYNVDMSLTGKHQLNPKMLNTNMNLKYAKNQAVDLTLSLKDQSTKLTKMNGKVNLVWPGSEYSLNTDLSQKSAKQYTHNLNFKSNSGMKNSISTTYKMAKSKTHSFITNLKLNDLQPLSLSGETVLDPRNFEASGEVRQGNDVYSIGTTAKISRAPNAKFTMDVLYPARHMTLEMSGGKNKNKYEGHVEAAWDADRNKNSKIQIDGTYHHKSSKTSVSMGGSINFLSPFENYKHIMTNIKYGSDDSQHDVYSKFLWGDKSNQITSTMNIKKPISLRNIQASVEAKTPFKGFRVIKGDIAHKLNSELNTVLKGSLEKENAKLSIQGQDLSSTEKTSVKGNIAFKSSIKNAESATLSMAHTFDLNKMMSNAALTHNGKSYAYDMNMLHKRDGYEVTNSGDLTLTVPKTKVQTTWSHKNADDNVKTTLSATWNKKTVTIDLSGNHELSSTRKVNGELKIQSPWKPMRDMVFTVKHRHGYGLIDHNTILKQNGKMEASTKVNFNKNNGATGLNFEIVSPLLRNDVRGKLDAKYASYPLTGSADLEWAPESKATVEGSLMAESWDDSNVNVRLTTPSQRYQNLVFKASNKKQGDKTVSHMNLDYGVRENIDLETVVSLAGPKSLLRMKLMTPFKNLKSLDTGVSMEGSTYNFNTHADFELLPVLGKFEGMTELKYDDDLKGKVRVDTPLKDYPYFELSTYSTHQGHFRRSQIQGEYYPGQVYSLDTKYSFDLPIIFEANLKSPFPEYNDIGIEFKHHHSDVAIETYALATYQPSKKIETDFKVDWASEMEGSLIVKTPFNKFETNKVTLRLKGDSDNFASHGEIDIGEKVTTADVTFKNGYTTVATLSFSSPIPGMENIDAVLKKKGPMHSMKGGATFTINGEKMQTTFNNKLTDSSLKSGFTLSTPYHKTLKLSIDHSGDISDFKNEVAMSYGRKYMIDTSATFGLHDTEINGNGKVEYKLGEGRNTAELSFNKKGLLEDMTFDGSVGYNRDEIKVNGLFKTIRGIDATVVIKTPFDDFKNVGMTLSHTGDINNFSTNTNINYMDGKNINGKVDLEYNGFRLFKLSSDLFTPFNSFESTSVKINHVYNDYNGDLSGNSGLTTTIGSLGNANVVYSKTGGLSNLIVDGLVNINGKDIASLVMKNKMLREEVHSKIELKSKFTPDALFTLDHRMDPLSLSSKTLTRIGRSFVSAEAITKKGYNFLDAETVLKMSTPHFGQNKASINFHHESPMENSMNLKVTGKLNKHEVELTSSKQGSLEDLTFEGSASYNNKAVDVKGTMKTQAGLEGILRVTTPFKNFKDVGFTVSHVGVLTDFTSTASIDYMDSKNINGKVELSAEGVERIRFNSELKTPIKAFKSFNMKFNNDYDTYTGDIDGDASISTSIMNFGSGSLKYNKKGDLNNLRMSSAVLKNGMEVASMILTNRMLKGSIESELNFKSSKTPKVSLIFECDLTNSKTTARASYGKVNVVMGEVSLTHGSESTDASALFEYTIEEIGSNQGSINLHKEGSLEDIKVEVTGKYRNKESKLTGTFTNKENVEGSLTVNTPIEGFKNIGMSFKHSGGLDRFNCEGKFNPMDNKEFSGKINFYRSLFRLIQTTVELKSPIEGYEFTKFEYRHEGETNSYKCYSTLEYGNMQKITYDLDVSLTPKFDVTVTLKTPFENYEELMASATADITKPKYTVNSQVSAGKGKTITLNGNLDTSDVMTGSLSLSTPIEKFTDIGMNFRFSLQPSNIDTEGRLVYMDGKIISGKLIGNMEGTSNIGLTIELTTPFAGYEFTKFEKRCTNNNEEMRATVTIVYNNGKKIEYEEYVIFGEKLEHRLNLNTPFEHYEHMMTYSTWEMTREKCSMTGKINAGNGNIFTFSGVFDITDDISGSVTLSTPYQGFHDVGMNFMLSGRMEKFNTEGKLTYMDGKDISGKINFYKYMWRNIVASAELSTPFKRLENSKMEMTFEDNSDSINTMLSVAYDNDQSLSGNIKLTYSPNYEAAMTLHLPFLENKVVSARGSIDVTEPLYEASYSMNLGSNQMYTTVGKLDMYSPYSVDASLVMSSPLEGMEYTKAEYNHKLGKDNIDGMASLTYNTGEKIIAELKSTITPSFDATVTLRTPFAGYENMQAATTYETSYKSYQSSASLNLGSGNAYSMNAGLDYASEPLRASAQINTPLRDYNNMEAIITHEGQLTNFKCTGYLNTPMTNTVNANAALRFDTFFDMFASASLDSSLPGYEELKMELRNSDIAGEKKSYTLLGWTRGKEIIAEGMWNVQNGWYERKMHSEVSLSTPFPAVRNVIFLLEHSGKDTSFTESVNFEMNGVKLLDMDSNLRTNGKWEGEVIFREPRSMQYTFTQSSENGITDAEVTLNWNRDETDSNFKVVTVMSDKSDSYTMDKGLDISVETYSRKVGITHKLTSSSAQTSSNGKIYWDSDDESKLSYDLQMNLNKRRNKQIRDGSLKLGFPSRTLGLDGSYSNNGVKQVADASFSWDMDRDDSKKVNLKSTMISGETVKGDISISLPSIRKEIRVDGEISMINGRVLFDTKTDISYSPDTRKTLTLTSKLMDVSEHNDKFNYSLALGLKHPYTNVDLRMNSRIGSSNEHMTLGMEAKYMTAQRQDKNLALLAEINQLKKEISLQVTNPINKIELTGNVISSTPFKVQMLNKVNGIESFRSDLSLDADKKAFMFNAYVDSDKLTVSALYPNSTAFNAKLTRHTAEYDQTEALLGVRLNTSQLMHTKLSWRPEMFDELKAFAIKQAFVQGKDSLVGISKINQAVADEITAKYIAITNEIDGELRPLVGLLNQELALVASEMDDMSNTLRRMYEQNQFHLQYNTDVTVYYMKLQELLQRGISKYRTAYPEMINSLLTSLDEMKKQPVGEMYKQMIDNGFVWVNTQMIDSLTGLNEFLGEIDTTLTQYLESVRAMKNMAVNKLYNASYIDYMANKLSKVSNIEISPNADSYSIPEEYTNAIYEARDEINSRVNRFMNRPQMRYVKYGVNEVYQQGVWAYNYWELKKSIEKNAEETLELVKEIIEDELREYVQYLNYNPITVWAPAQGEIQADLLMPVPVHGLDEMPDLSPLMEKAQKMVDSAQNTLDNVVQTTSDLWHKSIKSGNEVSKDLSDFKPSKKYRKKGRRYNVKASRQ